jgi:hypothetical protein
MEAVEQQEDTEAGETATPELNSKRERHRESFVLGPGVGCMLWVCRRPGLLLMGSREGEDSREMGQEVCGN